MAPVETQLTEKPTLPKIGIIYPPPEVRNIVDKTASFVARNGPDFESRIRQNEINNSKFNFLNPNDPYHAYYQHKVRDFAEGKASEPSALKITTPSSARLAQETPKSIQETFIPKDPPSEFEFAYDAPSINAMDIDIIKLTAQFVARNGRQFLTQLMNREQRNYQFDFLRAQHSMFGYFTKLVEQYTKILIPPKDIAGKLFEELENPKRLLEDVRYRVEWQRYQERQRRREEEAAERERVAYALIDWHDFVVVETVEFQPNETGNFPLPTNPEEVGVRVLEEERGVHVPVAKSTATPLPPPPGSLGLMPTDLDEDEYDNGEDDEEDEFTATGGPDGTLDVTDRRQQDSVDQLSQQDYNRVTISARPVEVNSASRNAVKPMPPVNLVEQMGGDDMELSDEEDVPSELPPPTYKETQQTARELSKPTIPITDQVIIRHDYDPKAIRGTKRDDSVLLVSPFTGEKIPASQAPKHIRVGLLDPKWVEQRDREIRENREQEQVYASGALIDSSLKMLAERRTDIFGVGVDEIQIGKKLGEQALVKSDKLIWDGYSASSEAVVKRTIQAVNEKDKQDLLKFQQQLEAARDKIGVQTSSVPTAVSIPANPVVASSTTLAAPIMQPPPPPPQAPSSLLMMSGAQLPMFYPPGMAPPGLGVSPVFMPPPPTLLLPPLLPAADGEPEAKRSKDS